MERETIEEEKAQVDRYKQLLLKQRDIMIALTQRLNERDEQIMALQDELDAYDRHQKELEEKLDEKTAALIHLQRVTMEHNANSPIKNADLDEALGGWSGEPGTMPPAGSAAAAMSVAKAAAAAAPPPGATASHKKSMGKISAGGTKGVRSSPGGSGMEGRRRAAEARRAAALAKEAQLPASKTSGVPAATSTESKNGERIGKTGSPSSSRKVKPQEPATAPNQLISYKQYQPYDDATVFVGSAASARPGEERNLLSAEDKISELARIVERQKADHQKLSRELEEVQAEKVSNILIFLFCT